MPLPTDLKAKVDAKRREGYTIVSFVTKVLRGREGRMNDLHDFYKAVGFFRATGPDEAQAYAKAEQTMEEGTMKQLSQA